MYQQQRIRVRLLGNADILRRYRCVDGAASLEQFQLFVRELLLHISAQVAVRDKQNLVIAQLRDDLHRRRGGHTDIADGFQLCGGIDVCDHGMIRILHLHRTDHLLVHLLRHRTTGSGVRKIYVLFRRKDLYGLRHKAHAAHQHILLRRILCLYTQRIGIPRKISNFQNITGLITMCQDTEITFLFQPQDLLLNLTYFHDLNSFPAGNAAPAV